MPPSGHDRVITSYSIHYTKLYDAPAEVPSNLAELLRERASEIPDRKFLLEREPGHGEWRSITYGEARQKADAIAQWLRNNFV